MKLESVVTAFLLAQVVSAQESRPGVGKVLQVRLNSISLALNRAPLIYSVPLLLSQQHKLVLLVELKQWKGGIRTLCP